MNDSDSSPSLVTEAQLFGWRKRVREIDEEVHALKSERGKIEELLAMATHLMKSAELLAAARGSTSSQYMDEALSDLGSSDTFPKAVMAVANRAFSGGTYQDYREALLNSALGERLRKSDKGFYHAMSRLKDSGDLIDYKGFVFTPENLEKFKRSVAAGLKEDKHLARARGSQMIQLIYKVIAKNPGMIARDVIAKIRELDSELDAKLSQNDGSAYNAIARMKKRGEVVGRGHLDRQLYIADKAPDDIQKLAVRVTSEQSKRNEAPNGEPASASETDEGATSSKDGQATLRLIG